MEKISYERRVYESVGGKSLENMAENRFRAEKG